MPGMAYLASSCTRKLVYYEDHAVSVRSFVVYCQIEMTRKKMGGVQWVGWGSFAAWHVNAPSCNDYQAEPKRQGRQQEWETDLKRYTKETRTGQHEEEEVFLEAFSQNGWLG